MREDTEGKKAVRAGVGYTIGNILVKGLSFISVPLFARLMSVSDFGIVNTFVAYSSILLIVIGLALHSSLKNAYIDLKNEIDDVISSLTILPILFMVFCCICVVLYPELFVEKLGLDNCSMVFCLIIDSYCLALITYYNCVLALEYKYWEYLIISLAYSVVGIILSTLLILFVFPNDRYMGRIIGTLISAVLISGYILSRIYKKSLPKVNFKYWKYGLKISLPIIPHGLSQIMLSQFDRLMIKKIIGNREAGLYSFAYTIGTIYQVVIGSIDTAWTQWFFSKMTAKDYKTIKKVANYYVALMALGAIFLMLVSPELIFLMGGKKYSQTRYVILPVLLAMFFAGMYNLPSAVEYYLKKTGLIAIGTLIAAILNISLNIIFIRKYGYIAAAYTTVVCYFVYFIIHIIFAYKIWGGMLYDMKKIGLCACLVMVSTIVIHLFINAMFIRYCLLGLIVFLLLIWAKNNMQSIREFTSLLKK